MVRGAYRHAPLHESKDVGLLQRTLYILRVRNDKVSYLMENGLNRRGTAIDGF